MEEMNFWEEAESLIEQFDYDGAINIYRTELKNNPNDTKILDALGDALLLKGDTPQAQQILVSSIAISPEEGASKYMNMAQILEGQDSLKYYQKGLEL